MLDRTIEEERWRRAVDSADFGLWDLDPRAELVQYSPQWKARLGFAQTYMADSTAFWRGRVHADDLGPMLGALRAHLDGFTPTYEMRFRLHARGRYLSVLSRGRVVERNERGDAVRMVGTMIDLAGDTADRPARSALPRDAEPGHPWRAMPGLSPLLHAASGSAPAEAPGTQRDRGDEARRRLLAQLDDLLEQACREGAAARP